MSQLNDHPQQTSAEAAPLPQFEDQAYYTEENDDILEAFTVKARRKRLRTLKYIAAFNIARHLDCQGDLKYLNLPMTLKPLVNKFIISYSGDYILDMS